MDLGDSAIDLVAVTHQDTAGLDAGKQRFGLLRTPSGGIAEQPDGRPGATRLCPEITLRLRRPPGFLEYLERGFVGMNEVGVEQMIAQQVPSAPPPDVSAWLRPG